LSGDVFEGIVSKIDNLSGARRLVKESLEDGYASIDRVLCLARSAEGWDGEKKKGRRREARYIHRVIARYLGDALLTT